jgi:hypothetical protein
MPTDPSAYRCSPSYRLEHKVEASPFGGDAIEHRLELPGNTNITRQKELTAKRGGDRANMGLRPIDQEGPRDLGAGVREGARTAGCDASLVGDADHESALALKRGREGRGVDSQAGRSVRRQNRRMVVEFDLHPHGPRGRHEVGLLRKNDAGPPWGQALFCG